MNYIPYNNYHKFKNEKFNHPDGYSRNSSLFDVHLLHHLQRRQKSWASTINPNVPSNLCRQQARYGSDFELSEDKKKLLEEADLYMKNHAGAKYMNRHRTKEFLETKIKELLDEKKQYYN